MTYNKKLRKTLSFLQIASGMSYIGKKDYVHRELMAKNILIGKQNLCKITGLSLLAVLKNGKYQAAAETLFPVRWSSVEVMLSKRYSIKSDVWSFGILLTEIVSNGEEPYKGISQEMPHVDRFDTHFPSPKA